MLFGIAFEFGLCIVLCYAEPFQKVFGTDSLSFMHWCLPLPWFWYDTTLHTDAASASRSCSAAVRRYRSAGAGPGSRLRICAATHPRPCPALSCRAVSCDSSLRSLVVCSVIVLYDEMRKYITRNYPDSKFTQLTVY